MWLANCCLPMSVRAPIWDRGEGTGDKQGQNQRRTASLDSAREKQRQSERRLEPDQVMVAEILPPDQRPRPNPGPGEGTGDKQGQNQRRGVSLDSAREKQRQSERRLEPDQVIVANALNSAMAAGLNPSSPP